MRIKEFCKFSSDETKPKTLIMVNKQLQNENKWNGMLVADICRIIDFILDICCERNFIEMLLALLCMCKHQCFSIRRQ